MVDNRESGNKISVKRRVMAGLVVASMSIGVVACTAQDTQTTTTAAETALAGTIDVGEDNPSLFDTSTSHDISLEISQEDIDTMLQAYQEDD